MIQGSTYFYILWFSVPSASILSLVHRSVSTIFAPLCCQIRPVITVTNAIVPPASSSKPIDRNGNHSLACHPPQTVWPIWDPEALLRNGGSADPQAQSSVPRPLICYNCGLIYAASWMQLLPVSTVPKKLWVADSLRKDRGPVPAYIYQAHCRWILRPQLGGISLGSFGNRTFFFFLFIYLFFTDHSLFLFLFPSLHPLQWCNSSSQAPSVYSL